MDSEENKVVGVEVKIPDCVDKTLESLTAPLAKSAGTTLADLWYLAFGSISTFAEKKRIIQAKALENFKNKLKPSQKISVLCRIPKSSAVHFTILVSA